MWKRLVAWQPTRSYHVSPRSYQATSKPVVNIQDATVYHRYPSVNDISGSNPALFSGLDFSLPTETTDPQYWSIISPSSIARTNFLQVLAGQHICIPPQARTFPYLSEISQSPQHAIKYVGFDADRGNNVGGTNVRGAYLSARYESRREETDFSVQDYLTGHTELNALEQTVSEVNRNALDEVVRQLNLTKLLQMPVANLSNGQTRRTRIAKALMARPEVLLLDGPFMGLDPNTLAIMSNVLMQLAQRQQPRLIMSLRPEDGVPDWVSHLVVVDEQSRVLARGAKSNVARHDSDGRSDAAHAIMQKALHSHDSVADTKVSRDGFKAQSPAEPPGEALVEMRGVRVAYGDNTVLGGWKQAVEGQTRQGLWWSLHRGQRCGIFGPNGSGKTTMLSLITSDHPQTYSLPINLFGRSRLPGPGQPGISLFDVQKRMGHSSPEVHAFFPKQLTVSRALQSAWADAPLAKPSLDATARRKVDACLRWFARELHPGQKTPSALEQMEAAVTKDAERSETEREARKIWEQMAVDSSDLQWADNLPFRELSFSNQRLVLFLRALVASPDLVILDEALSGIDEATRDKALLFLSHGEKISRVIDGQAEESALSRLDGAVVMEGLGSDQALLVISHSKEDVPGCLREWICLPEPGEGKIPRTGALAGPLELNPQGWNEIWGRSASVM